MKEVRNRSNNALVAEYSYNGLNFRTGWHYDVTRSGGGAPDGTVDGNDPWYWFVYNERWQTVGTFRGSDANPKERFIYHGAGLGGRGGSSYIDSVVCLDRDLTNGWAGAADGTLEARWYINQNWRGDVAVVTDDVGVIQERTKYSAYGVPTCLASADYDRNGVVNSTDDTKFQADLTALDPLSDFNFDGATDFFDYLDFTAAYSTQLGENNGRGVLSRSAVGNRFGYAGYQWDPAIAGAAVLGGKWHVRHRVLDSERGTWLTRDPLGYHDGEDLYEYVKGRPVTGRDPSGLKAMPCTAGGCVGQANPNPTPPISNPDYFPPSFLPDGMNKHLCKRFAEDCWATDSITQDIKRRMVNNNCPIPTIETYTDSTDPKYGSFTCGGSIKLNCHRAISRDQICATLAHEATHALQCCRDPKTFIHETCRLATCREYEAVVRSGQCCRGSWYRDEWDWNYNECVLWWTRASVGTRCRNEQEFSDNLRDCMNQWGPGLSPCNEQ